MQTFVPHLILSTNPSILDNARLNKQRLETLQILSALHGETKGWANHPATKMWDGYVPGLVKYGVCCCLNCKYRGIEDKSGMLGRILEFHPFTKDFPNLEDQPMLVRKILKYPHLLPWWWGEAFQIHDSHRKSLVFKSESFYGYKFGIHVDQKKPPVYVWPIHYFEYEDLQIDDIHGSIPDIRKSGRGPKVSCTVRLTRYTKPKHACGTVKKVSQGHTLIYCEDFNRKRVMFLLESKQVGHVVARRRAQDYNRHWNMKAISAYQSVKGNASPYIFTNDAVNPERIPGRAPIKPIKPRGL